MIEINNVSKYFSTAQGQVAALQDIHLHVARGEIFGVIGRSGAGKSTLIRCVNLLERPDQGEVWVNGEALLTLAPARLRQARQKMGMVFQHFNLLSSRTVFENVALPLELIHQSRDQIYAVVQPLLELVGLADRCHAYPAALSGGQKQRVAIARALALQPSVLLCDEMTSSLDPETTQSILQLIQEINQKFQITVLLITHEMEVIKQICHRVAVMDQGRIVEQGELIQIFREPKHATTRALTQAAFHLVLPPALQRALRHDYTDDVYTLLRIFFIGDAAGQPVINELIRRFNLEVNILQSDIALLHGASVGMMMIAAHATPEALREAVAHLRQLGLMVEEVGYVARDDWHLS
jgi:D-methionine transport system ATP-binding protein